MTTLLEQLAGATERGEMELHFQPEIDLTSGSVTAMEALLRWAHPGRGMLWPIDFLGVAEAGGLSGELGSWVLANALKEARHFAPGTRIWINVSPSELLDPAYPSRVAKALAGVSAGAGAIGIDIPGPVLAALGDRAADVCAHLRAAGAHLSLECALSVEPEDLGPAVVSRIYELGIEVVKINRSLIRDIDTDPELCTTLGMFVDAVVAAGATVTAGGVESWAEAQQLQQLGVLRAHGFLLSPPMRADRIRWALGRGDVGRGSYLQDGSGWLTSSRYAAALHDVLPRAGNRRENPSEDREHHREQRRAPVSDYREHREHREPPVPQVEPPVMPEPVQVQATPISPQRRGSVSGAAGADPFGRNQRLSTPNS